MTTGIGESKDNVAVTVICTGCSRPLAVMSNARAEREGLGQRPGLANDARRYCSRCDSTRPVRIDENATFHLRSLIDFDLDFLEELVEIVDGRLEDIGKEMDGHPDPDSDGILDRGEYICGLGFVVCQNYLTAVYGELELDKDVAWNLGPKHRTGETIVRIVRAGANYWKHHAEWKRVWEVGKGYRTTVSKERNKNKETVEILEKLDVWSRKPREESQKNYDYTISNLLFEMLAPAPARFRTVVPLLEQWRDEVLLRSTGRAGV